MVHPTVAGWLPAVEFTETFKKTVEPGVPEPDARLTATCAKAQDAVANARKKRNVQARAESFLSMFNFMGPRY